MNSICTHYYNIYLYLYFTSSFLSFLCESSTHVFIFYKRAHTKCSVMHSVMYKYAMFVFLNYIIPWICILYYCMTRIILYALNK